MEALGWTGAFGPQTLPERQLVEKLMSGLVLVGNFFPFMALEGRSFVHVLSKEAGLHQQHTSS